MISRSKRAAEHRSEKTGEPRRRLAFYTPIYLCEDDETARPRDYWPSLTTIDGEPPPAIEGVTYAPKRWMN